ncbi:cellulose-binding domain-containing protein [Micromonospora sp. WMMC241]|uniref:cellulose-binding domain-containing protein n=1 Tax=Micromonospora sp. WMMC241 TaxID=3015159 RepID=UPI0022B74137|nr:cellulose-binding domain-containing protein [Micromonospora sp. WMMC241]MCZ7435933.1 cellulose-binding domain-containing protein [Micromonospora sp. WMMC241]
MTILRARTVPTLAVVAALAATVAATGTALLAGPAAAAQGCRVDYTPNQWPGGFTAAVKVSPGDTAVSSWTVTWTYAGDQRVTNGWNATVTQSGATVTARNVSYNGSIPAGGSTEFGVQGTFATGGGAPTGFTLNGVPCNGAGPTGGPTTTVPTTAPPTSAPPTSAPPTSAPPTSAPPTTAPPTSPPPTTNPPVGCAGAVLCDGFENQTGSTPSGDWTVVNPDCAGAGTATIDTATTHSGSRAVRINGAAGYCNHVFIRSTKNLAGVGSVRYGRIWVRHTTAQPTDHTTMIAMADSADGNKDLRMGGQNGAMQWNRASDDATLPEQSPAGVAQSVPLPTNRWACLEFMVDGSAGQLRTWLDGAAVAGLTADGVPTHDIDGQWYNRTWRPQLTDLKLGWESYGGGADTLWYDDVAVGSSRIGC